MNTRSPRRFLLPALVLLALAAGAALPRTWAQDAPRPEAADPESHAAAGAERAGEAGPVLDRRISVDFRDRRLDEAFEQLSEAGDVELYINWAALGSTGIERDRKISLGLRNVRVRTVLELMLEEITVSPLDPIDFSYRDEVIRISTMADLQRHVVVRVYDIRPLLIGIPNFDAPPTLIAAPRVGVAGDAAGTGADGRGGGAGGLLGGQSVVTSDPDDSRAQWIEHIRILIANTVGAPEPWALNEYTLQELNGNLIVKTTPELHGEVAALLKAFQLQWRRQVAVEARLIRVPVRDTDELVRAAGGSLVLDAAAADDFERRATSGEEYEVVATARLLMFNGQRAHVLQTTRRPATPHPHPPPAMRRMGATRHRGATG